MCARGLTSIHVEVPWRCARRVNAMRATEISLGDGKGDGGKGDDKDDDDESGALNQRPVKSIGKGADGTRHCAVNHGIGSGVRLPASGAESVRQRRRRGMRPEREDGAQRCLAALCRRSDAGVLRPLRNTDQRYSSQRPSHPHTRMQSAEQTQLTLVTWAATATRTVFFLSPAQAAVNVT
ncbi:hypothetical protein BC831DRAFT_128382 [Entophlyctis helioformis]|nr:hypothetical protein BC831DRAFT_128382 [Entophlyctis helioformis]